MEVHSMNCVSISLLKCHPKNQEYYNGLTPEKYEEIKRSIVDGNNTGEINGVAGGLIAQVWNEQNLSGAITAARLDSLLRGALAEIINTSTRIEEANVKGSAVALVASGDIGSIIVFG
jgi:hypothetical protein